MKTTVQPLFWMLLVAGIALGGCNLPVATPTGVPADALTMAAQTLVAQNGLPASSTLPAVSTPTPQPPAATTVPPPTASPTATVAPTPTPSVPMVSVTVNTNCRTGPGKAYPRVGALLVGQSARVVARDPTGGYLYIENPAHRGTFCWLWGQYARLSGPQVNLPVFTPVPLPADATLEFVGVTQCMDGVHLALKVTNTGGVTWQSYTADYLDLTAPNGFSAFQTMKFYDDSGCVGHAHEVIDDLTTGESGYIQWTLTGSLIAPGNHIKVIVRLYDTDGPGGRSITREVEFTFPTP